jgi:hypothetical protein
MWMAKRLRLATVSVGLLSAWACTVADKGEYTFTDNPSGGAGHGGTGHAGTGGTASGGKSGSGTAGTLDRGGRAGRGGSGGRSGGTSTGGTGGGSGEGGEPGMAGAGAISGKGGSGGSGGSSAGEAGAGGEGGAISSCTPDPCVHGQCSISGGQPVCTCDAGYEGPRCAINHNDCAPNPCLHNGVCADRINDFRCDCTGTGYSGTTCQTPAPCSLTPCLNGGVCTETGGSAYTCNCTGTGFEGANCQTNHNDCTGTGCHESEGGMCTDLVNGFSCSYYASCGAAYTAGHTTPGLYYIDPDGGDPSNAAERYCYRDHTLSGLGMGVYAATYTPNWVAFNLSDLTTFPGAFKYLYDKQGGLTNLNPNGTWSVQTCCFRDSVGPFMSTASSSAFMSPAKVNATSYECKPNYNLATDPTYGTMWLDQATVGPIGTVPLDPNYFNGWVDTGTGGPCTAGNVMLGLYWQYTPDP